MKASKNAAGIAYSLPLNIYYLAVVLLMLKSVQFNLFWNINGLIFELFAFATTFYHVRVTNQIRFTSKYIPAFLCFTAFMLLTLIGDSDVFSFVQLIMKLFIIGGVIGLKAESKQRLFSYLATILSCIIAVSLVAWIAFVFSGFTLFPYKIEEHDTFHTLYDFKLFLISYRGIDAEFMRFSSVFLEPGWVGAMCCFCLFGIKFNLKDIRTYVLGLALILSFSLSAYVNIIICGIIWLMVNGKIRNSVVIIGLMAILSSWVLTYNEGDNALNSLISSRLQLDDEKIISGNNRTNDEFDIRYNQMIHSEDLWFGFRYRMDKTFSERNYWFASSSGIKKTIMVNGIIGTTLLLFYFILIARCFRSKEGWIFVLCFMMATFVRDLFVTYFYLIVYILVLSLYYRDRLRSYARIAEK